MNELSELPGWDELVAAGNVEPLDPRVLAEVQTQVRRAAEPAQPRRTSRLPGRRWSIPKAALAAVATAAVAAAIVVGLVLLGGGPNKQPVAIPVSQPTASPTGRAASCVVMYSLTTLAQSNMAFDGTVEQLVTKDEAMGRVQITFGVNEWFRGGTGQRVTVIAYTRVDGAVPLDLQRGSRLLVSGHTQPSALPPIAWTGCGGFTRPYDAATAADWKSVLHG